MKKKERFIWIGVSLFLLIVTTASGLNNWIFAGDAEKTYDKLRLFNEVFNLLRTEYYDEEKVTPEQLIPGAIEGMINTLDDPHTSYLPPEMYQELQTDTRGEFGGLGIVIGVRDDWITVISPIDDTPAARAGIRAGDRIIKINGDSTEGYTTMDAVKLLRGEVGTSVTVTIQREGEPRPFDVTLVRGIIQLETVKSTTIDEHIGYIRISQFSEPTAGALRDQLDELRTQGIDALIVDLRNNPGGLLSSVINISDMFLENGVIVSTRGRDKSQNQVFMSHKDAAAPDIPLVVLINEGSASASEIFAGAVKDNNRGLLVGKTTFGKGSVQTIRELPDGSGMRITTALYYTPSGVSIDHVGVTPNRTVEEIQPTEAETQAVEKLNELGLVEEFVENNPGYSDRDLERFVNSLVERGIEIRPVIVRRMARTEKEKNQIPSLVDLDYDVQLKYAVDLINSMDALAAGAKADAS
ncbi:MAG: S41 family peptidase [Spirochaetota bacterium]